jgi:hypothetical protein
MHWLKNGDRNTKYFHQFASDRRKTSRICRLVKEDGEVVTNATGIHSLVTGYYRSLFTSHAGDRYEELLQHIPTKVTEQMNGDLLRYYSDEEIKYALDSMGGLKAPGPDGMPTLFYKKYWGIVGEDVVREVKYLLDGGEMPNSWNDIVVVLIPKVAHPDKLKDWRPIGFCNVVYKIASKVLANRLKLVLPDIISLNQSAFVPRRLITDNVLLAYELTHYLQNKRIRIDSYAALKLDMSKAYDCVEWEFLRKMMCKLGFHQSWVEVIMKFISSVSYRVKLNGELTEEILPQRGLRQGDPYHPIYSCYVLKLFPAY